MESGVWKIQDQMILPNTPHPTTNGMSCPVCIRSLTPTTPFHEIVSSTTVTRVASATSCAARIAYRTILCCCIDECARLGSDVGLRIQGRQCSRLYQSPKISRTSMTADPIVANTEVTRPKYRRCPCICNLENRKIQEHGERALFQRCTLADAKRVWTGRTCM